jgi:hypothetical protein
MHAFMTLLKLDKVGPPVPNRKVENCERYPIGVKRLTRFEGGKVNVNVVLCLKVYKMRIFLATILNFLLFHCQLCLNIKVL